MKSPIIFEKNTGKPFKLFEKLYLEAIKIKQKSIDAMVVATAFKDVPSSRVVNLKYVRQNEFIFFTNYKSQKGKELAKNNNISCLIYWNSMDIQVRFSGKATATSNSFSDFHYSSRLYEKNIAAYSSNQSQLIDRYSNLEKKYQENLKKFSGKSPERPKNWGGISIKPDYFEFWRASPSRLNKRECYKMTKGNWNKFYLQS
tara:strand:+ start:251 stop:853 length:603 start_codon:yes stop_codon:yes gene_type:complete